jgi:hypothetical protein
MASNSHEGIYIVSISAYYSQEKANQRKIELEEESRVRVKKRIEEQKMFHPNLQCEELNPSRNYVVVMNPDTKDIIYKGYDYLIGAWQITMTSWNE